MKTYLDCIPCLVRQSVEAVRMVTEDSDQQQDALRQVMGFLASADFSNSPPMMARGTHRIIRQCLDNPDPYAGAKRDSNRLALGLLPELRQAVEQAPDSLVMAVRLAIAGNIIDFGIHGNLCADRIRTAMDNALAASLDELLVQQFTADVRGAKNILYLADNAGEIAFDRLLIEQLGPQKVTVAVKGMPILNDALFEDAEQVGLCDLVEVISNGGDAPGTVLELCSNDFRERFESADLVISKGQGNYETLTDVQRPIYFLLKVKCPIVAEHLGCELGDSVLRG